MTRRMVLLLVATLALPAVGCGGEDIATPSIHVKDKGCNFDCNEPEQYYLYFTSSIRGDYAVSVHDSSGARWSIIQAGSVSQREETKVQVSADDVPGSGGVIRITVVTGDSGTGRADCSLGTDWATSRCN